jgi:spermidine synthase
MIRGAALGLTAVTGFTALVYQVAWQKYLAALLGSHSEATAAVLGIFLGGLSLGYWLFGRLTQRLGGPSGADINPRQLLAVYGLVEAGIGLYALLFPWLFRAALGLSLWLPQGFGGLSFSLDVLLATALIGPPTVLMGGTIPILTQALSQGSTDATRIHALVYATNSAGAFVGALSAGFWLLPELGLKTAVVSMGVANLAVGLCFMGIARVRSNSRIAKRLPESEPMRATRLMSFTLVALLSGFSLMTLQVVFNRIAALSFGASHFAFAMIVACFVLCIAMGSLAVAAFDRIDRRVLLGCQWALVIALTALYPHIEDAPYWAHRLRTYFPAPEGSLLLYYSTSFVAIFAVLSIPLSLAGATLPLIFHHLHKEWGDLGAVAGRLYGWNTLGSLVGALIGGYALLFWLDLHHVYRIALLALVAAAGILTLALTTRRSLACIAMVGCIGYAVSQPAWAPRKLSAGLFNLRRAYTHSLGGPEEFFDHYLNERPADFLVSHSDGPTSSVSVEQFERDGQIVSILKTNGKSEGAIPLDNPTTSMLALVPAILQPAPRRAFVIGYGTGETIGTLSGIDSLEEVVVAEISQAVIDAAPWFEDHNGHALANPKTRLLRADAYRTLLRTTERFDIIASEPSNPWVSGVELLFSRDFLEVARDKLTPNGIYAQWFQTYQMDERTVSLALQTYRQVFDQVSVWYMRGTDLLILGSMNTESSGPAYLAELEERWQRVEYQRAFAKISIDSFGELLAHELFPLGVVAAATLPDEIHTLEHPTLSHNAIRAYFRGEAAVLPATHSGEPAVIGARNSLLRRYIAQRGGLSEDERYAVLEETCVYQMSLCATLLAKWGIDEPGSAGHKRAIAAARASRFHAPFARIEIQSRIALLLGAQSGVEMKTRDQRRRIAKFYRRFYHHAVPFLPEILDRVDGGSGKALHAANP